MLILVKTTFPFGISAFGIGILPTCNMEGRWDSYCSEANLWDEPQNESQRQNIQEEEAGALVSQDWKDTQKPTACY